MSLDNENAKAHRSNSRSTTATSFASGCAASGWVEARSAMYWSSALAAAVVRAHSRCQCRLD